MMRKKFLRFIIIIDPVVQNGYYIYLTFPPPPLPPSALTFLSPAPLPT